MRRIKKYFFAISIVMIIFINVVLNTIPTFAWGDNSGRKDADGNLIGREFFTLDDADAGRLDGFVTFNSFVKGRNGAALETGPETAFVGVQPAGEDGHGANPHGVWENNITIEDGKEYIIRLFIHNNNPNGKSGMATGTRIAVSIPSASAINAQGQQEVEVNGFITSDNAVPNRYWDYVRFNSDVPFHLEYQYGSAALFNNGIGAGKNGCPLPDDIVTMAAKSEDGGTNGTLIGYDALDGNVPGCYEYSNYITICVKAVYDYGFTTEVKVRKKGEGKDAWRESVDAKVGDKVEFRIDFKNTATKTIDDDGVKRDIMIRDILPSNLKYVEGTTKRYVLKDGKTQVGTLTPDGDLVTSGVNIGSYAAGVSAAVSFTAEVVDTDLKYGTNTLVNWGQASVNSAAQAGHAVVKVQKSGHFEIKIGILVVLFIFCILCLISIIKLIRKIRN